MDKLKLCPFCDGKPHLWERKCYMTKYAIGCDNLECILWIPKDVWLRELHNYASCYVYKEDAIKAWNTRSQKESKRISKKDIIKLIDDWKLTEFGHYECDCIPANPEQIEKLAKILLKLFKRKENTNV